MDKDSKFTRDENGNTAVRIFAGGGVAENPDYMFTRDDDGNIAVRVVFGEGSGGGGDSHNKGYFADLEALQEAYPTAEAGDWAILNSTDTVWIWDTDTSAWVDSDQKGQVTSVNNQTGAVTVQETLVSGTNIKSINGNSILGAGNMQVSGFLPFPAGWTTNSTTKALCDDIAADATTVKGSAFLGEVTCSDLPASIVNSEINVYINDGTTAADKVIILELTSGNVAPYRWVYVYWNGGTDVSGWKTWQETLVSGTNIKTVNGNSLLGSGDLTISGLPSQTGNAGKALFTDGTDASWGNVSSSTTGTLLANGWVLDINDNKYKQTVNVTGVTASNDVFVSPFAANAEEWGNCGVIGAAQASGTITFWAESEPTNALQFTATILA